MTFDYDILFLWIYTISGNPKNLLMHDTQNHYQYLSRHLNIMINTISNCGSQIDTTVKQLPKICPQNKARVCTKNSFTINNTSTSYYIPRFSPEPLVSQPVQPNFNQQLHFWFSDCFHFGNQRNIFKIDWIDLRKSRSWGEPRYPFVMTTPQLKQSYQTPTKNISQTEIHNPSELYYMSRPEPIRQTTLSLGKSELQAFSDGASISD